MPGESPDLTSCFPCFSNSADTAGRRHAKSMKQEPNSEAAEPVQTKEIPAVDLPQLVRRLGRFRVSEHLVKTHPQEVMKVMAECLVVRCELRYETMTFDYVAISPHFDVVPEWMQAPVYEALMESVNTGTDESPKYEARFKGFSPTNNKDMARRALDSK